MNHYFAYLVNYSLN